MTHPLLDPVSARYYDAGERPAIEILEEETSVIEQIGCAKGNLFKYQHRRSLKGEDSRDAEKLSRYAAYLRLLQTLPPTAAQMSVSEAWQMHGIEIDYTLPAWGAYPRTR